MVSPELVKRHTGDGAVPQIADSANEILTLLDRYRAKATFKRTG